MNTHKIPTDGYALDFDSLVEIPQSVTQGAMPHLALAPKNKRAFDYDSALDHTTDHIACPACRAANAALQADAIDLAALPFIEAAEWWKLLRAQSIKLRPRTHEATSDYIDALKKFFGALRLCDINPGHLRGYQIARTHNLVRSNSKELHPWKRKAGHSIINHEICTLGQMMKHCLLWHQLKPYYFPLDIPNWSPREILSEEEEEQLWKVASAHPEAALAYWVAAITNNTSAAGIELRGLRLKHLFLSEDGISEIYIPEDSVKNNSRPRKIALNTTAKWAVTQCYKRALKLSSCEPDHYLFPFRVKRNTYDPALPASRWFLRNSWNKLRKATGFMELNPHDLRHHCITRLLENDVEPETVRAIAGHVTAKMMEYYAHHRKRVKYEAVMAIDPARKKPALKETGHASRFNTPRAG